MLFTKFKLNIIYVHIINELNDIYNSNVYLKTFITVNFVNNEIPLASCRRHFLSARGC